MITREELISNPENWHTTDNLNLDFFDATEEKIGGTYYLKQKGSDEIYYGKYNPTSKDFLCLPLHRSSDELIIKREDISFFLSLPPISFDLSNIKR